MDIEEITTIEMLTKDSVNILTRRVVEIDGELLPVGENHRHIYRNYEADRNLLALNESEEIVNAVFAMWGDKPSITMTVEN